MRKKKNPVLEMVILISQIGITMLVPIIMCTLLGTYLGDHYNIRWIAVAGFIVGAIAGFQNVYHLVKKYLKDEKRPGEIARENEQKNEDIKKN